MNPAASLPRSRVLRWLAPLLTFGVLIAVLAIFNRDQALDPVDSLGPSVESEPAAATAESISALEGAVRADPTPESFASLGDAYLQAARDTADSTYLERADGAFAASLGRDPGNTLATIGQGTVALAGHEFARGLELGREAHRLEPALIRPYAILVDANIELGRYGAAAKALDRMVGSKPTLAAYSRVSYFRELRGDIAGALHAMRLAVAAGGGSVEGTAYVQHLLGKLQLLQGRPGAAERAFNGALSLNPAYGPAIAGIASVAAQRGELNTAIAGYRDAVAELPNTENATLLADALAADGRTAASERAYDRAIKIARADPVQVNQELVLLEADHGSIDAALATARKAWRLAPGAKSAEALAWALHASGRSEAAMPLAREAIRLHRANPAVLVRSARVAAAAGQTELSVRWLEQALAINPRFDPLEAPRARALLNMLG